MFTFSLPLEVLRDITLLGLGLRAKQVLGNEGTILRPGGGEGFVLSNTRNCPGVFLQGWNLGQIAMLQDLRRNRSHTAQFSETSHA
jgi:hypothetical protein